MQTTPDWQKIVFTPHWLGGLDKLSARRFGEGGLAEEASSYVLECISKDNWTSLENFKGQSKPETFLHTLTVNFIEEFSRKRFGRPRPPEWLKQQGEFWITIWKLICLERQIAQAVVDRLSEIRDALFVKDVIRTIKARLPWCGESQKEIAIHQSDEDDEAPLETLLPDHKTPDTLITEAKHAELLLMLNCLINDNDLSESLDSITDSYQSISRKFSEFGQLIELSNEEKLILKMVYQDGLNKTLVATTLGMQAHLPGRILKRVFDKIKTAMQKTGINIEDIVFESA